jgi:hypothetical protein
MFTDKDNFVVNFDDPSLNETERNLVMASGIFVDLMDSTLVYAHLAPSSLKGITDVLSQGASWSRASANEVVAFSRPAFDVAKRELAIP